MEVLTYPAEKFYRQIKEFKDNIEVGDRFWLPQEAIAIKPDVAFADGFIFTVIAKYPCCVLLEKDTRKYGKHRQSISYVNLLMMGRRRKRYANG